MYDLLLGKKTRRPSAIFTSKSTLNTVHHALDSRLCNLVVDAAAIRPSRQKATVLHRPEMLGRHVAWDLTRFGEFSNRKLALEHHLDHAKPDRMRQGSQAFSGLLEILQVSQS